MLLIRIEYCLEHRTTRQNVYANGEASLILGTAQVGRPGPNHPKESFLATPQSSTRLC